MADVIENKKEREKKTPEEIKQKILDALNDKPLNALEISKAINSNWSTVKEYLANLVKEKRAKEIVFGGKNAIYQKITGDTYFSIPIKEIERKILRFIFFSAIKEHKELTGQQIRRTDLAKLTDYINSQLKLNLPVVWYIYGPVPLMIIDIQKDYYTDFIPESSEKIKEFIVKWIKEKRKDKVREARVECYQNTNNQLYQVKEELYQKLEKEDLRGLSELTFEFYLKCLNYSKELEDLPRRFHEIVSGAIYLKLDEKDQIIKSRILLAFDSLWKYVASKMLFDSLIFLKYPKEEIEIYLSSVIETKRYLAEEMIKELDERYIELLPDETLEYKPTNLDEKISKVMAEWLESEVWRE